MQNFVIAPNTCLASKDHLTVAVAAAAVCVLRAHRSQLHFPLFVADQVKLRWASTRGLGLKLMGESEPLSAVEGSRGPKWIKDLFQNQKTTTLLD